LGRGESEVYAVIWVAGYERIRQVTATIYGYRQLVIPNYNPPSPNLPLEYDLEFAKGTLHRGTWEGTIKFPISFPNGTYWIAFSATNVSGLSVNSRNIRDIDEHAVVHVDRR